MNSVFIKVGNHIINREQVTRVEYKKFSDHDATILNASSMIMIYTADGGSQRFTDNDADLWWDVFEGSSLALRD